MPQAIPVLISIAITVAANYVLSLFSPSGKTDSDDVSNVASSALINTRSPTDPYKILYGPFKVGGNQPYVSATGDSNEYLHIIQTIGEGEIDGLDASDPVQINGKPIADYGDDAYYEFFPGSDTQTVCETLHTADPDWNDARRGTAYIYVRLKYNSSKFSGMPDSITVQGRGRKVYDPETKLTAYSTNMALCYYDLVRNTRFGVGIPAAFWDEDSIVDSRDWCDDKGYVCSAIISDQEAAIDISEKFLVGMRHAPTPVWDGSLYSILPLDYDAPVMSLTEADIAEDSWTFGPPSAQNYYNACKLTFIDASNDYVSNEVQVTNAAAVLLENNDAKTLDVRIINSTDRAHCQLIGTYLLNRSRIDRSHSFTAGRKAMALLPGNVISITHSFPGWTAQRARVTAMSILSRYEVSLTVEEEYEGIYSDEINAEEDVQYNTNLPDPLALPPAMTGVAFTEEIYQLKNNYYVRALVGWVCPATYPFLDHVEVWISNDGGDTYIHYTDATGDVSVEPCTEGGQIYVKLRPVSINKRKDDLENITPYLLVITGKVDPPSDVTGFTAALEADGVVLIWAAISDIDVTGYEITLGGSVIATGITGTSYRTGIIASGSYTFGIRAIDGSIPCNKSAHASEAVILIAVPAAATNLTATGIIYGIMLTAAITIPSGSVMEIWESTTNNRVNASHIKDSVAAAYARTGLPLVAVRYYWVRLRDAYGNVGAWHPSSATAGIEGTTSTEPDDYLTILMGSITEDELAAELGVRVNLIDRDYVHEADTYEQDVYGGLDAQANSMQLVANNIQAQWTVKLNINGHIAGVGLMLDAAGDSEFAILANKFEIINYSDETQEAIVPFVVGNVGGVSTVGIDGNLIVDGSILARTVGANEIIANTANIKDGIITSAKIEALDAGKITTGTILARPIKSSITGARVEIFPDSSTGLHVIDDDGESVFKALIGGNDIGDIIIGDFAGNKGLKWDKSAQTFTVRGIIVADDITTGTLSVLRMASVMPIQIVGSQTGGVVENSPSYPIIPYDDTIPQQSEGFEYLTCSITPTNANNVLYVDVTMIFSSGGTGMVAVALFKGAAADALIAQVQYAMGYTLPYHFSWHGAAGTTNTITFKVRAGHQSSGVPVWLNAHGDGSRFFGGVNISSIKITEVKA